MILKALCDYYDRKRYDLPAKGVEAKQIGFLAVLDEKHRGKEDESRKCDFFEHCMDAGGYLWFSCRQNETNGNWHRHENNVLHKEIAHRQMDVSPRSHPLCGECHDERNGEKRDD